MNRTSTGATRRNARPGESSEPTFAGGFQQIDVDQECLRRRGITLRAVLIGLLVIGLIAAVEPFSRSYKGYTPLIGSNFPTVVIFILLIFVVCVNPLLRRLLPGSQFAPSELAVIFGLIYTACCIPGTGIIRFWMTALTGGFFYSIDYPSWAGIFEDLPDWLFPTKDSNSPIIEKFWRGFGANQDVPWETWFELASAWLVPFLAWGIFFFAVFIGIWCLVSLLRKQWVENEKLSFPVAQVILEMMRPPAKGRLFNDLFRNKLLWFGAGAVFLLHATNVLHVWFPNVPAIPISWDQGNLFTNFPWNHMPYYISQVRIYFTAIGIVYFITTRCSFSLWFFVVAVALAYVIGGQIGRPIGALYGGPWRFEFLGAMIVLIVAMAWVSRAHLKIIALAVIGRGDESTDAGEYMSYRFAAIGFLVSFAVAVCWLTLAGVKVWVALILLVLLLMIFLTIARIVSETGLFFFHVDFKPHAMTEFFTVPPVDRNSFLLSAMVSRQYWGTKENLFPYAINAIRVADGTKHIRRRRWLIVVFLLGLFLAYTIAAMSWGWCAYRYGAVSFADDGSGGTAYRLREDFDGTVTYRTVVGRPTYSPLLHTLIGAGVTALLALARFRWTRWPLYPIGWLLCSSWAMHVMWMSIFLSWLAKVTILKFGGPGLYERLKPLFLGFIVGEVVAGAGLTITLLLTGLKLPYDIMPA